MAPSRTAEGNPPRHARCPAWDESNPSRLTPRWAGSVFIRLAGQLQQSCLPHQSSPNSRGACWPMVLEWLCHGSGGGEASAPPPLSLRPCEWIISHPSPDDLPLRGLCGCPVRHALSPFPAVPSLLSTPPALCTPITLERGGGGLDLLPRHAVADERGGGRRNGAGCVGALSGMCCPPFPQGCARRRRRRRSGRRSC